MAGIDRVLAGMGYRPAGSSRASETIGNLTRMIQGFTGAIQQQDEKKKADEARRVSMYKTLRDAGYSSQKAYDAVLKDTGIPSPGNEKSLVTQQAEANLAKTEAATAKLTKETEFVGEEKLTDTKRYREDLVLTRKGDMSWDDLEAKYPNKAMTIAKLQKQYSQKLFKNQPLEKQPVKKVGRHQLIARAKKEYASMNDATKQTFQDIKTYKDVEEFLKQRAALEAKGVDVDAIEKYYNEEIAQLIGQGIIKPKK